MRWNKVSKSVTTGVLCAAMAGSLAACGSEPEAADKSKGAVETENYTLTGFISFGGNSSATQKAVWFTEILKEKLGITLNLQDDVGTGAGQIMQSLLASGELPDIVGFNNPKDAKNAASAGLLLNLNDYEDQLPNIYGNKNYDSARSYQEDLTGGEEKGLYIIPTKIGPQDDINFNPQLRWDVYKKVGKPEIQTLEDYLPVLKEMQDAYPETADGKPVYGISLFSGWDSNNMALATYISTLYGVDSRGISPFTEAPSDGNGEVISILDDESKYKRALDFFFQANQMGLVDPDSITQKWDNVLDKYNNGQILFSPWEWAAAGFNTTDRTNVDDFQGYQSVWAKDFTVPILQDNLIGENWSLGISAACKNKEAALKFLDYFYSYECVDLLYNGPEGEVWELDQEGKRYVTDKGWDIMDNGKELSGGGKILDAYNIINSSAMTAQTVNTNTKDQTMSYSYWEATLNRNRDDNKLVSDWKADHDGAVNMFLYAKENNKNLIKTCPAFTMMSTPPDDLQTPISQIADVVKTYSWKMVFAKDQSEYDSLWKEMRTKADGLGLEKVMDWGTKEFANALDKAEKYK